MKLYLLFSETGEHAILPDQVIWRTGNGNSERACACVWKCVGEGEWRWGAGGEGVWNNIQKKSHMIWSIGLIYLASEKICCMWFGGENVFFLHSQPPQTQHMETFSERPWVCEKSSRHLFLLPLFIAFHFFSNWSNYIHLLAKCWSILMTICDPLRAVTCNYKLC